MYTNIFHCKTLQKENKPSGNPVLYCDDFQALPFLSQKRHASIQSRVTKIFI
jgi:hypothetical protein